VTPVKIQALEQEMAKKPKHRRGVRRDIVGNAGGAGARELDEAGRDKTRAGTTFIPTNFMRGVLWHDGQGMCLFAKRLERGRFIWPSSADGTVTIRRRRFPEQSARV
jgi:hypothetical protein